MVEHTAHTDATAQTRDQIVADRKERGIYTCSTPDCDGHGPSNRIFNVRIPGRKASDLVLACGECADHARPHFQVYRLSATLAYLARLEVDREEKARKASSFYHALASAERGGDRQSSARDRRQEKREVRDEREETRYRPARDLAANGYHS